MNFTREPILETIISAKEDYKLKIKSTKHEGSAEYLVDAVEVVCFGTTFFYRSGEPAHTFFVPAQDFEIEQVRQVRISLKTPTETSIKIAGGAEGGNRPPSEKSKENRKEKPVKDHHHEKGVEKANNADAGSIAEEKTEAETTKAPSKDKHLKRSQNKRMSKDRKKAEKEAAVANSTDQAPQASIFKHLLRPPEALISDSMHKYQSIINSQNEKRTFVPNEEVKESKPVEVAINKSSDDPELTSEAPKQLDKTEEQVKISQKPLTLKEKMKKVLAPAMKLPENQGEDS
jgi:hypothetical protein